MWDLIAVVVNFLGLCPADMAPIKYFCIDKYEAPNVKGAFPLVMQSAIDAQTWCKERGKRLCTEYEWDTACEISSGPCNNDKQWIPWSKNWRHDELWQGSRSGSYVNCRTSSGVYDLIGNVEEWVISRKGRDWPYTLKGGWWAHAVSSCYKSNDFHEPAFQFYETGMRCCRSLKIVDLVQFKNGIFKMDNLLSYSY